MARVKKSAARLRKIAANQATWSLEAALATLARIPKKDRIPADDSLEATVEAEEKRKAYEIEAERKAGGIKRDGKRRIMRKAAYRNAAKSASLDADTSEEGIAVPSDTSSPVLMDASNDTRAVDLDAEKTTEKVDSKFAVDKEFLKGLGVI